LWVKDHGTGEQFVPSLDGNRNVTRLIQWSDRSVAAQYERVPNGGLLRATGPMALANPIRFSSEYHDDVTGLVYYGYRYYSPQTHRWLSKDPIGYAGGLNLYGFVGNDAVNGRDELGLALGDWWDLRTWFNSGFTESWRPSELDREDVGRHACRQLG
jgi:RHS repeat-associated protein